ncbi:oligosaccharide flippase family protein [Phycisphaera mikurensis]|uniref:Putative polysaccharide biosynthesis protein n=1 Tax=Phycisphaera mikurensis (strain NBRC 102666 / KCTC 22515 / FYK2301M01) TaxID=1142394 RepID=I0IFT4_PHYMF|nr:oligosaccharide flippase family protein [Phycisphaera mikurensis]MBB6440489.1 PST family polysaccharide transporter [Phycisphaera mikurensis]BAM04122.1 putative polysaccharide biosynthesis protein [Phycisphaera mikurensis NBRC 102666]
MSGGRDQQSLGVRTRRSAVAALGSGGVQTLLGVAATAILARQLGPEAFGLMAMATTAFAFLGPLADFGLPHALVHHSRFDPPLAAAMFRLNRRLVLLLVPVLAATGPLAAWFYGHAVITPLVLVCAGAVGFATLLNLHRAVLRRGMRFEALAAIETVALGLAVAAAVAAAAAGAGVWALAVLFAGQRVATAAGCWLLSGWRPLREPAVAPAGELRVTLDRLKRYSGGVTASRVVLSVGNNLDRPLIGGLAGDAALGLYQKSFEWSTMVARGVQQPLQQVVVSAACRLRDGEEGRYRHAFRRALSRVYLASMMPAAVGVVVPGELVRLLLGPRWDAATPVVRVLCAGAVVGVVAAPTKWLFLIEGDSRRQVLWSVGSAVTGAACVSAGALLGAARAGGDAAVAVGVAQGFALAQLLVGLPGAAYATRRSKVRLADLLGPAAPALAAAVAAALAAAGLLSLLPGDPQDPSTAAARASAAGAVFALVGGAAWLLLARRERPAAGPAGDTLPRA